jgi:hypothetical protein
LEKNLEEDRANYEDADEIIKQVNEIKKTLPYTARNKVMAAISKIWAKIMKFEQDVAYEILTDATKTGIQYLLTEGITHIK